MTAQAVMRPAAIVVLQPARERRRALGGAVIRPPIRPLSQGGLDKAFRFAIRARSIRARPARAHVERAARGPEARGAIAGAVVAQNPADPHAALSKPRHRSPHEGADRDA